MTTAPRKGSTATQLRPGYETEGRLAQSDRRALAELTPLQLLREYSERVRTAEAVAASPRATTADRVNYVQAAERAEREMLDRLGSLYKMTRR